MEYLKIAKYISEHDKTTIACSNSTAITTGFLTILASANNKNGGKQVMCIKKSNIQALMFEMKASVNQKERVVGYATKQHKDFANSKLDKGLAYTPLVYSVPDQITAYFIDKFTNNESLAGIDMHFCDILVIDEANAGDVNVDFLIYIYEKAYKLGASLPKLVLIYNKDSMQGVDFSLNSRRASIQYHNSDLNIHSSGTNEMIVQTINSYILSEPEEQGILVYLPSDEAIVEIAEHFNYDTYEIIKLYSFTKNIDKRKLSKNNGRRIILVTPESDGIEFENITIVFDSLYKEGVFNGEIKRYYISKELADRRASMAKKICYRMAKEGYYIVSTSNVNINDTAVMSLEPIYLRILLMGMFPEEFLLKTGITKPTLSKLINRMSKFELLNVKGNKISLTKLGFNVIKSKAGFMEAMVINKSRIRFIAVIFTAVVSNPSFTTDNSILPENLIPGYENNEIATSIYIILTIIASMSNLSVKENKNKIKDICINRNLDLRATIKVIQNVEFINSNNKIVMKNADLEIGLNSISEILNTIYDDSILLKVSVRETIGNKTEVVCKSNLGRRITWINNYSLQQMSKITKILPFEKQLIVESGVNKVIINKCWTWTNDKPNARKPPVRQIKAKRVPAVDLNDDDLDM